MDLPQIFLLVVIIVISVILTIIGVQIIGLLRETRETVRRLDKILEDAEFLTRNLTKSSSTIAHISDGLKSGVQLVGTISQLFSDKKKK